MVIASTPSLSRSKRQALEASLAVPARNAKAMLDQAQGLGIDPVELLAGTELDDAALTTPGGRISYADHITLHRNLLQHPLPADFAFGGPGFSIASYGMLGYAMMSSATLARAIQIAVKYTAPSVRYAVCRSTGTRMGCRSPPRIPSRSNPRCCGW